MKLKFVSLVVVILAGCVTTSGTYVVTAHDANGKNLNEKLNLIAEGSGIYTARNALYRNHPKATIIIKETTTNQELKGESPYFANPSIKRDALKRAPYVKRWASESTLRA